MNRFFPDIKKNFGFGCMRLPMNGEQVDLETTAKMVDAFLEAGFNYFDTAHGYIGGQSETALKACLTSRHPRSSYILTNKLSPNQFNSREDIRPLFQSQLDACGVEYFDFYLMHAMNAKFHASYVEMGAFEEALALKAEGKIRHIGMSFHDSAEVLDQILTAWPEIEVVQIQYNYVDLEVPYIESRGCYEVCVKHGKPVIVMEPVKGGSLVNLPQKALDLLPGGSPASYAIRFAASPENMMMVLSGMSNMEQMMDNISYMADFKPLTEEEYAIIAQVRTIYQGQHRIPCTGCRYCVDGCPAGIAIPDLFTAFNDLKQNKEGAAEAYAAFTAKAPDCVDCGQCEGICPQTLSIRQLLAAVDEAFNQ